MGETNQGIIPKQERDEQPRLTGHYVKGRNSGFLCGQPRQLALFGAGANFCFGADGPAYAELALVPVPLQAWASASDPA